MSKWLFWGISALLGASLLTSCANTSEDESRDLTPLLGSYVDEYGGLHQLDAELWQNNSFYHDTTSQKTTTYLAEFKVLKVGKKAAYLIAQNGSKNPFNPNQFSRFDFTFVNADFYICQTTYFAVTLEEAEKTPAALSSNPAAEGCGLGNFPWTKLIPAQMPIAGNYTDNFGGSQLVSFLSWISGPSGRFHFLKVDSKKNYAVAYNDPGNTYSPGLYSRFDWLRSSTGNLYYCQTVYDKASFSEAENAPAPDASAPETQGCGGKFPWTKLSPKP